MVLIEEVHDEVVALVKASGQFTVPLEKIWGWLGYTRKDHSVRYLQKHFKEGKYTTPHLWGLVSLYHSPLMGTGLSYHSTHMWTGLSIPLPTYGDWSLLPLHTYVDWFNFF